MFKDFLRQLGVLLLVLATRSCPLPADETDPERSLIHNAPQPVLQIGHPTAPWAYAFSVDGKQMASADTMGIVKVWDATRWELRRTIVAHQGNIFGLAFSPDGRRLATSGSGDRDVRVWDIRTGTLLFSLMEDRALTDSYQDGAVRTVAFSPDGEILACSVKNGETDDPRWEVLFWDLQSFQLMRRIHPTDGYAEALAYSPDGHTIAFSGERYSWGKTLELWDATTNTLVHKLEGPGRAHGAVAFSADGSLVAAAWLTPETDTIVTITDVRSGQLRQTIAVPGEVRSVNFSPDGQTLLGGGFEKRQQPGSFVCLRLWDLKTGQMKAGLPALGEGFGVVPHRDEAVFIDSGRITRVEISTGKISHQILATASKINSVRAARDGSSLGAASRHLTVVWDLRTGRLRWSSQSRGDDFNYDLVFSPDSRLVAQGLRTTREGKGTAVEIRSASTGQLLHTLPAASTSLSFSPDSKTLVTGSWTEPLILWNVAYGQRVRTVRAGHKKLTALAFSSDGRSIATGEEEKYGGAQIMLWDKASSRLLWTVAKAHDGRIHRLMYSRDGGTLVSIGRTNHPKKGQVNTIRMWEARRGRALQTLTSNVDFDADIALAADGKRLASTTEKSVLLWNLQRGDVTQTLAGHEGLVTAVDFAGRDKYIVSGSWDGAIKVWDSRSGKLLLTLIAFQAGVGDMPGQLGQSGVEWIAYTPEGYYDSSVGAKRFIRWRVDDQILPVQAFEKKFHRRGLLRATLSKTDRHF